MLQPPLGSNGPKARERGKQGSITLIGKLQVVAKTRVLLEVVLAGLCTCTPTFTAPLLATQHYGPRQSGVSCKNRKRKGYRTSNTSEKLVL